MLQMSVQEWWLLSRVADRNFLHWARAPQLDGHAPDDFEVDTGTETTPLDDDDASLATAPAGDDDTTSDITMDDF